MIPGIFCCLWLRSNHDLCYTKFVRGRGGTGRRAGFRFRFFGVGVRFPSAVPDLRSAIRKELPAAFHFPPDHRGRLFLIAFSCLLSTTHQEYSLIWT